MPLPAPEVLGVVFLVFAMTFVASVARKKMQARKITPKAFCDSRTLPMPPPSVLKRKTAVSAGDDYASTKRVNSEEDFEQIFSSTASEASSSSSESPSSTSFDVKSDASPTEVPLSIWVVLQKHKVTGCYLPPTDMWPKPNK